MRHALERGAEPAAAPGNRTLPKAPLEKDSAHLAHKIGVLGPATGRNRDSRPSQSGNRDGGGYEIRTREGVNPTRFPSERHRPLGESSVGERTGCHACVASRGARSPCQPERAVGRELQRPGEVAVGTSRPVCLTPRFLARRYLAQLPQGRKTARVSELFWVREEPLFMPGVRRSAVQGPGSWPKAPGVPHLHRHVSHWRPCPRVNASLIIATVSSGHASSMSMVSTSTRHPAAVRAFRRARSAR